MDKATTTASDLERAKQYREEIEPIAKPDTNTPTIMINRDGNPERHPDSCSTTTEGNSLEAQGSPTVEGPARQVNNKVKSLSSYRARKGVPHPGNQKRTESQYRNHARSKLTFQPLFKSHQESQATVPDTQTKTTRNSSRVII